MFSFQEPDKHTTYLPSLVWPYWEILPLGRFCTGPMHTEKRQKEAQSMGVSVKDGRIRLQKEPRIKVKKSGASSMRVSQYFDSL